MTSLLKDQPPSAAQPLPGAPPPPGRRPGWGDDEGGPRRDDSPMPGIATARLGMLMFLAAEGMLFAGFIGAFLVFRFGNASWPPPMQPRLPVAVTGVNTAILLLSGVTMFRALRAAARRKPAQLRASVIATVLLGIIFLAVQGYEWARLVSFGLTMASGIYGATFYTLIGTHGLHVLGAVTWLLIISLLLARSAFRPARRLPLELCGMYWFFVVGLWPLLYVLVYLH